MTNVDIELSVETAGFVVSESDGSLDIEFTCSDSDIIDQVKSECNDEFIDAVEIKEFIKYHSIGTILDDADEDEVVEWLINMGYKVEKE